VDYSGLGGTVTFDAGQRSVSISIDPIAQTNFGLGKTVTLTLVETNYLIDPNFYVATIGIFPNTNFFGAVTNGLPGPVGIDWHPIQQALVVSVGYQFGSSNTFVLISGNPTNVTVANFSGVGGLPEEVKVATVKTNASGFLIGDTYYGTGVNGVIGKLSADGTVSNLTWALLSTNTTGVDALIRGGLYVDQTGRFGRKLITVTGAGANEGGGIWQIDSSGSATLLARVPNTHLEGVITLPDDPRYGPLAGKIVTGAESKTPPLIYAVDTNRVVTSFYIDGIEAEDFNIIPTNQDLYCVDQDSGTIAKLPRTMFTNYVGDLLITAAGDGQNNPGSGILYILHWDAAKNTFITRCIKLGDQISHSHFEHVRFAPIDLPSIPYPN
jgi:hypothetical protein